MSQPTTTSAGTAAPGARPAGKKYAGLTRGQWIATGVVFAVVVGVIIWRRHAASSASSSTGTTASSSECTDSTGASVPCDQADNSGDLSALQTELESLLAAEGQSGASGGGGGVIPVDTGTSPSGTDSGTSSSSGTSATPTTSTGSTATATAAKKAGAISNLQASGETKTSAKISWNAATGATGGYAYRVTEMNGTLVKSATTKATSVTLSGLHPGWEYNFGIQGLPGGPGNNIHFSTKSS